MRHFLVDSGLDRVRFGLRQDDSSYVSDSVEVLSALIIIAQIFFFKSLLPFITFVNYGNVYLLEKFIHILFSYFPFSKKKKQKTKKKFVETVAVCKALLDHNMEI